MAQESSGGITLRGETEVIIERARSRAPLSNQRAPVAVDVSLVIPVYDEEACLEALWERLRAVLPTLMRRWEVIFIDDGSRDRSSEILRRIKDEEPRVRLLRMTRNSGQTAALDAGFRAARGEWVVTLDADLQNPPEEIPRLLAASSDADLVYGRRRHRKDSWPRLASARIANTIRNWITGHQVSDTGCSLKLYRRRCLERLPLLQGMHRFLPTLFAFYGFRIREIDVGHEARAGGRSKYGMVNRAFRGLIDCFGVRWMRSRGLRYDVHEE